MKIIYSHCNNREITSFVTQLQTYVGVVNDNQIGTQL